MLTVHKRMVLDELSHEHQSDQKYNGFGKQIVEKNGSKFLWVA